jgi:hypothetical protein
VKRDEQRGESGTVESRGYSRMAILGLGRLYHKVEGHPIRVVFAVV